MDRSNRDLQREVGGVVGSGRGSAKQQSHPTQHLDYRVPDQRRDAYGNVGGPPPNNFAYSMVENQRSGDLYGATATNSGNKYAHSFANGTTAHAVEQTLAGGADDGTQTQDEMAVRPSEPHFDEQTVSRYGQVTIQSERSNNVPVVSAITEYGNVKETRNNQMFHHSANNLNESKQRVETGNFHYPPPSTDVRQETSQPSEKAALMIDSQQYRVRQSRDQNLYAPQAHDAHLDGYGGAALPKYPILPGNEMSRQRALSGGPTVRAYSNSRNHSISADGRSNRSGSVGVGSPVSKKSGMSRRSGMTRNPLHFEDKQLQHAGPGIDDRQSHLYREYDNSKRVGQTFYQRAALAGIKNLETISYRKDSTVQQTQGRFPEKYVHTIHKSDTNYSSRKNSVVNKTDGTLRSAVESFNLASQMLRNIEDTQPLRTRQSPTREMTNRGEDNVFKEMSMSEQQLILESAFTAVCDNIMSSQMHGNTDSWLSLSIDDKLLQFASFLSHMRKDYRLGAIVGVYILFKNNVSGGISGQSIDNSLSREEQDLPYGGVLGNYDPHKPEVGLFTEKDVGQIGQEITKVIIEEVFSSLTEFKNQDPLLIKCELEVIGLFGIHQDLRSSGRLQILRNLLQDQNAIVKQKLIPNVMATMIQIGYEGLRELLDIAERDINGLQDQIVSLLIQMRIMQRLVIVPSILAQINQSYDPLVKQESLAMLNRLGTLVWESGGLPLIIELLDQGIVDRQLLASVLRTSGGEGEQLLLKLLKFHQNEKVRASAAAVMAYRLPTDQLKMHVSIALSNDQYEIFDHTKTLRPGQMCTYRNGKISSLVFEELKTPNILEEEETPLSNPDASNYRTGEFGKQNGFTRFEKQRLPRIEVHARDFLASLSRVMQMNELYFKRMFENDDYSKRSMLKILNINVLNGFNSMNVQCILPRIDQNLTHTPHIDFMELDQINISQESISVPQRQELQNDSRVAISQEIVKALCQQLLKEEKTKVREVIAGTIGQIGKPEAHVNICVDALIKAASMLKKSEDSILKSMIIWSLGRLASYETGMKAKKILMDGLQSPHWRVRAAACTSIANFGPILADCCLPILMKLLRDGSQNKQIVAETIISLGPRGETEMISLLRTHESKNRILNNNKSKECIVKSLALANIEHPNIDFIIETLFYTYSQDSNASIRKASLIALDILHKKSERLQHEQTVQQNQFMMDNSRKQDEVNHSTASQRNTSFNYGRNETNRSMSSVGTNRRDGYQMGKRPHFNTYLQPKNLLPFFYKCLADKSTQVRECARLCIKNFGAHGELLFIEGVSKENNPVLRAECALGLGSIGPQTFRSLLLALHDEHQIVKDQASQAILNNMTVYQIREQFEDSDHQRQTICCTIKELMISNNPNARSFLRQDMIHFLDNVLEVFEQMMNDSLRGTRDQINLHEGAGIRSRSKDLASPASERARSPPQRSQKAPLEMFQAAHQDINPLPPKKRPQSSSTYSKNPKVNPHGSRRMSKVDQAAYNQNSRYESSGKMVPKNKSAEQQNNLYMDTSKFLHQLKEEAVQDQRHAPIRIQNQGYMVAQSRRNHPLRLNQNAAKGMAGPGTYTGAGYPPMPSSSYQFPMSSNYQHINNPISKLNSLRSQEALIQYRLQDSEKMDGGAGVKTPSSAVPQDGQKPSMMRPNDGGSKGAYGV